MGRTVKDVKADGAGEEEGLKKADASLDEHGKFDILRLRTDEVGGCDACGGVVAGEKFVLCIKAGAPRATNLIFCEYHEGEILRRLLRSYLRRMKGVETVGFCGPLPKEVIPGEPIPSPIT